MTISHAITDPPEIPPEFYRPPERIEPPPPVETRPALLPFGELGWQTFERLCLRLASLDSDARYAKLYGTPGQAQDGIDIYVRRTSGNYRVWQSKRCKTFSANQVATAVDVFFRGKWFLKSESFTLCVQTSLQDTKVQDEIERQAQRLLKQGIDFIPLDGIGLSERLRSHPDIIDDFFGRHWVEAFCGSEAAKNLKDRLEPFDAIELRRELGKLYRSHFNGVDSGALLPAMAFDASPRQLNLEDRYVEPDISEKIRTAISHASQESPSQTSVGDEGDMRAKEHRHDGPRKTHSDTLNRRVPAFAWIGDHDRCAILSDPGTGKSTLLRVLALEILAETPRNPLIQARWAGYLPIWLPFSFWTGCVGSESGAIALSAALKNFLQALDAPECLWQLVEKALNDKRLLLLIDGLDEWTNEQAGRTAVRLLQNFVGVRGIAAILTSRPIGFQRVSGLDDRWQIANLAPLSRPQQLDLTSRWFAHFDASSQASPATQPGQSTQARAELFIVELHRRSSLNQLAGIPLLLWGLIALHLSQARLPRSRFAAYEKLTELLLHKHPGKRREAALARSHNETLSPDIQDNVIACLAYEAQIHGEESALELDKAKETLLAFLNEALDLPKHLAVKASDTFLDIGSDAAGLLVRKSTRHLGFMHRAFQEFLAALHIARLDPDEQSRLIEQYCSDPRWQDTILSIVYLTRRPSDKEALVSAIEQAPEDPVGNLVRRLLLSELAFGAFSLPPKTAKRLADQAFWEIETGTWMPLQRALLHLAMDGLHSDALRFRVQDKIRRWFPDRHGWRSGIFEAMGTWPAAEETLDCLWEGLHGTDRYVTREAAIALAQVYGGDDEVAARLKRLLQTPADPALCAAALDALALGWPQIDGIERLIADARSSPNGDLRLVAIRARIAANEHTDEDRDELLNLAEWSSEQSFERREELADALVVGWPADGLIKERCLETWASRGLRNNNIEREIASPVLLRGYASDAAVIERLTELFENTDHISVELDPRSMKFLPNIFPFGSQRLKVAIENWIRKQEYNENNISYAALAVRTQNIRGILLHALEEGGHFHFWFAKALLEGWGMEDPEVAEHLTRLARGSETKAVNLASRLPEILSDPVECRQRLLQIAKHPKASLDIGMVVSGFTKLGVDESDSEVVDALLDRDFDKSSAFRESDIGGVIRLFPGDPRVRDLAIKELGRPRNSAISAVAAAYGGDPEMRAEIAKTLSPLPAELRRIVVERLGNGAADDDFSSGRLADYGSEQDGSVKTAAAIRFFETTTHSQAVAEKQIDGLRDGLCAVGGDHDERRQAAFAGLLTLGRLDLFLSQTDRYHDEPVSFTAHVGYRDNTVLLKKMADHWDKLNAALDETNWKRIGGIGDSESTRLEALAPYAPKGSSLEAAVVRFIEERETQTVSTPMLSLFARVRPGSRMLKTICLSAVRSYDGHLTLHETDSKLAAAAILGTQFSSDKELLTDLEESFRGSKWSNEFTLIALCAGWPKNETVGEAFAWYRDSKYMTRYFPTYFHVIGDRYGTLDFVKQLVSMINGLSDSPWKFLHHCITPITRRLQEDEAARQAILERLADTPSPNAKASLPGLLVASRGLTDELRQWCRDELERQLHCAGIPEHGLDMSEENIRPVAHVLLDLLNMIDA